MTGVLVSSSGLIIVLNDVLLLQMAHTLYLVKIYHKALFLTVVLLDALTAKYSFVVAAVKMAHSLLMFFAEFVVQGCFILVLKVKVGFVQNRVFLYNLKEDVDVER